MPASEKLAQYLSSGKGDKYLYAISMRATLNIRNLDDSIYNSFERFFSVMTQELSRQVQMFLSFPLEFRQIDYLYRNLVSNAYTVAIMANEAYGIIKGSGIKPTSDVDKHRVAMAVWETAFKHPRFKEIARKDFNESKSWKHIRV